MLESLRRREDLAEYLTAYDIESHLPKHFDEGRSKYSVGREVKVGSRMAHGFGTPVAKRIFMHTQRNCQYILHLQLAVETKMNLPFT